MLLLSSTTLRRSKEKLWHQVTTKKTLRLGNNSDVITSNDSSQHSDFCIKIFTYSWVNSISFTLCGFEDNKIYICLA